MKLIYSGDDIVKYNVVLLSVFVFDPITAAQRDERLWCFYKKKSNLTITGANLNVFLLQLE